uniref:Brain specific homeobox n=1 Tax=Gallus gallus TaxID=9031 RepID=A0A8V1A3Q2_CHICK
MNLNFTSPVHPVPAPRPTSFFIEDILLHKPKPLREVPPEHFAGSLASRVPLLDYGYPLMPAPALLAPHPHPALHKPEHHHHHPYFLTTSGENLVPEPADETQKTAAEKPGRPHTRREPRAELPRARAPRAGRSRAPKGPPRPLLAAGPRGRGGHPGGGGYPRRPTPPLGALRAALRSPASLPQPRVLPGCRSLVSVRRGTKPPGSFRPFGCIPASPQA